MISNRFAKHFSEISLETLFIGVVSSTAFSRIDMYKVMTEVGVMIGLMAGIALKSESCFFGLCPQ